MWGDAETKAHRFYRAIHGGKICVLPYNFALLFSLDFLLLDGCWIIHLNWLCIEQLWHSRLGGWIVYIEWVDYKSAYRC